MRRSRLIFAVLMIVGIFLFYGCEKSIWCDPDTDLCWENPQRYGRIVFDSGVVPSEAVNYCEKLILGGYDDWRVPTIDELKTIVDGNPGTQPGGNCGVTAGASTSDGFNMDCLGGEHYAGPGENGCYWKDGLKGRCDKPDPAVVGHPLETWAINPAADDPEHWVAYITFDTAASGFNHTCSLGEVRCVRSDNPPPPCEINGTPCTEYFPSKFDCNQDLTNKADKLVLTINLPEPVKKQPHQLLAFFYDADGFEFPPLGPPDGGTDYNQVINPNIDVNKPLTIVIPATTYYREELLKGNYQLYVQVQLEDKFPPIPVAGDYIRGEGQASISFPINGIEHTGQEMQMEITLDLIGCPADKPVRCWDNSCVTDKTQCVATECSTIPDDSQVITCRYTSDIAGSIIENCADFPVADGWTEEEVDAFCKSQTGADTSTVVVSMGGGGSCLVTQGGFSTAGRCTADNAGKRWWAWGAPEGICNLFIGSYEAPGPFCEIY